MSGTALEKIKTEIGQKREEAAALKAEMDQLERVANMLQAIPDSSPSDLEMAAKVLRRYSGDAPPVSVPVEVETIIGAKESLPKATQDDLAGLTILEAATKILRERHGEPAHFRQLAMAAISRGYRSGRKDSGDKQVVRSFAQTLQRIAKSGGAIERVGDGVFCLPFKTKDGES